MATLQRKVPGPSLSDLGETGWVGRRDRDAPPLGTHCWGLSPCTGGGGRLLALDSPARGWGSGAGEGMRLGDVRGNIALPQVLEAS